jgi:hypothetical protein
VLSAIHASGFSPQSYTSWVSSYVPSGGLDTSDGNDGSMVIFFWTVTRVASVFFLEFNFNRQVCWFWWQCHRSSIQRIPPVSARLFCRLAPPAAAQRWAAVEWVVPVLRGEMVVLLWRSDGLLPVVVFHIDMPHPDQSGMRRLANAYLRHRKRKPTASFALTCSDPICLPESKGSIDVYDRTDGRAGVGCSYPASPRDQNDGRYSESRSTGGRLAT